MSTNPTLEQRVADLDTRVTALETAKVAAPSNVVAFTPRAAWYRPTEQERASFASRYGFSASIDGVQVQIDRLVDGDIAGAFARAAFGFDPTGLRGNWSVQGLALSRAYCDAVYNPHNTDQDRETMLVGAGSLDRDGEAICLMAGSDGGAWKSPGLGGSGHVGIGGATNAAQVVAAFLGQHAGPVPPHVA